MRVLPSLLLAVMLSGCGYSQIQDKDEAAKAGWTKVLDQDAHRGELVRNLVDTVKSDAAHEADMLTALAEAQANSSQVNVDAADPASLASYQRAQEELAQALDRALLVSGGYPELMTDNAFLDLKARLADAGNRATLAHGRYITLVQDYNMQIRQFPSNLTALIFGYKPRPNFTVVSQALLQPPPVPAYGSQDQPFATPPMPNQQAPSVVNPPQPAMEPVPGGNAPRQEPTE